LELCSFNILTMPVFSQISKDRLATCHPDLAILFNYVIKFYDCTIVGGYRTKADQEAVFDAGLSKVHYPGTHNTKPSNAVDAAPYEKTGIDWTVKQSAHFAGFVMAIAAMLYDKGIITHKIRSGADWDSDNDIDDTTFWDAGHFEIVPNPGEILKYYPE
jgi:peptidoglycan L-alanyl-D-glutamate endopeptidase CwlK